MIEQPRRSDGDETWVRLRDWMKGQKASERLAGSLLKAEGFDVDPSHPLGGADGGKDALCRKDGLTLVAAVYFPRGQQKFSDIKRKFKDDFEGVATNGAEGIVFFTNQELKLADRKALSDLAGDNIVELYHLERVTLLLNSPINYGLRFEYLGIKITEEEYIAFLANRDEQHFQRFESINDSLVEILSKLEHQAQDLIGYSTGSDSVAYFIPVILGEVVELRLLNQSEYPVFDIHGHFIDLDEPGVEPKNGKLWTPYHFAFGSIYPKKILTNGLPFDFHIRERYRINVFIQTRTQNITQVFRMAKLEDRIVIAHKTMAGGETLEQNIPKEFPGYDVDDPEKVFL